MGSNKIKEVDISKEESPAKPKKAKKAKVVKPKTTKVVWEELYTDLSPRTAKALRSARVKPEKLSTMSDGEITSIEGIGDKGLEEIRIAYPTDIMAKDEPKETIEEVTEKSEELPPNKRHLHRGSKRFTEAKKKVEKTKLYSIKEAVQLIKEVNVAKFNSTLTLHLKLKERQSKIEVTFPFSTGKVVKIEIASDTTLKNIEKGKIDFDILLATPDMMPKLAKHARTLGPKGLMPNPKTGTVTPEPEKKKKELEGGKTLVKCENKEPLMHVSVGKIEQKPKEVIANIQALIVAVKPINIVKATLASSMSPGIKLLIEK